MKSNQSSHDFSAAVRESIDLRAAIVFFACFAWHSVAQRLAHEPTMDAELPRHPGHTA
jgi:hypothetical protein